MYRLLWSEHFIRTSKKFSSKHKDLHSRFARILKDLEADPRQPPLKLHPLRGNLEGFHAISLSHKYRITLQIDDEKEEILLIDVGSHDDVYEG